MGFSERERVAHVYRRLGVGAHPDLVAATATAADAIARALDLSHPAAPPFEMEPPLDPEEARDPRRAECTARRRLWPASTPNGNPVHTVDYRSVYAAVLDRWLEADADAILGREWERLPVLSRSSRR